MPQPAALFEIRDLRKSYGARAVLAGLDFEVARGECLVILGRSGSGKSVTLRLLIGLDPPDGGSIRYDGRELVGLSESDLLPVRRRVAMLFALSYDGRVEWTPSRPEDAAITAALERD